MFIPYYKYSTQNRKTIVIQTTTAQFIKTTNFVELRIMKSIQKWNM